MDYIHRWKNQHCCYYVQCDQCCLHEAYFSFGCGIGVETGAEAGAVAGFDEDGEVGVDELELVLAESSACMIRTSKRHFIIIGNSLRVS